MSAPLFHSNSQPSACSVCGKTVSSRGLCNAHYKRLRRHGDPTGGSKARAPIGEPARFLNDVVVSFAGDSCLPWPYAKSDCGYGHIMVAGKQRIVSRVVCAAIHGPPPTAQHDAAHSCGRGHEGCVNPRHLSWKTRAENMADKVQHGTNTIGERHGLSRLTTDQVREIKALQGTMQLKDLAARFGVVPSTIGFIFKGATWKHV